MLEKVDKVAAIMRLSSTTGLHIIILIVLLLGKVSGAKYLAIDWQLCQIYKSALHNDLAHGETHIACLQDGDCAAGAQVLNISATVTDAINDIRAAYTQKYQVADMLHTFEDKELLEIASFTRNICNRRFASMRDESLYPYHQPRQGINKFMMNVSNIHDVVNTLKENVARFLEPSSKLGDMEHTLEHGVFTKARWDDIVLSYLQVEGTVALPNGTNLLKMPDSQACLHQQKPVHSLMRSGDVISGKSNETEFTAKSVTNPPVPWTLIIIFIVTFICGCCIAIAIIIWYLGDAFLETGEDDQTRTEVTTTKRSK